MDQAARRVLAAKVIVVGLVTLVLGELIAFCSFFAVQAVLAGPHLGVSLAAPRVPGAVLAEGVLLSVCALSGLALGAIIRHTAGAIAALAGLMIAPSAERSRNNGLRASCAIGAREWQCLISPRQYPSASASGGLATGSASTALRYSPGTCRSHRS